jgi:hypothetical protein
MEVETEVRVVRVGRRIMRWAAAGAASLASVVPRVAHAQYPGGSPTPQVGGQQFVRQETMPRTGVDVLLLVLVALALLLLGLVWRRLARRRPAAGGS